MNQPGELHKTRIMFFTDEPPLAVGATCVLSTINSFEIVSTPSKVVELLPALRQERPEILLLDFNSGMTLALISSLREAVPECRIVLWARSVGEQLAQQARQAGVAGFVSRTSPNGEFIEQLLRIAGGDGAFERPAPADSTTVQLTRRESQVVALLAQGLRNKEIAACLGITEGTVKSYLVHLFEKVGARDRFELAVLGLKNAYCGQAFWDGHGAFVTEREEERARPFLRSLVLVEPGRRNGYPEGYRKMAAGE
jgi:DNA-binding NarL/FixJ family response regulator